MAGGLPGGILIGSPKIFLAKKTVAVGILSYWEGNAKIIEQRGRNLRGTVALAPLQGSERSASKNGEISTAAEDFHGQIGVRTGVAVERAIEKEKAR